MKSSRKTCNLCRNKVCKVWDRNKENELLHFKEALKAIEMERNNKLYCFIPPKKRNWKFPDLVSKVKIINPKNPAIQLLR